MLLHCSRKHSLSRPLGLALGAILTLCAGCSLMQEGETVIRGRALLAGQSNHGGTVVVLDGIDSTYTVSNGNYEFSGYTTGDDDFTIIIRHEGYGTMQITGTLKYDSSAEGPITNELGTVTLPVWGQ